VSDLKVHRYAKIDTLTGLPSGDFMRVGMRDLGEFRDIVDAEYRRAGSAFHMRPMFYTGSPFGAEILGLADQVRT
jgi:hypothetical protein